MIGDQTSERPPVNDNWTLTMATQAISSTGDPELTILMPCLNEAETVASCIEAAVSFLRRCGIAGEVLISDNGSTDGSIEIAEKHGARVVHAPDRGYGAALKCGIEQARGRYVIMGDSD